MSFDSLSPGAELPEFHVSAAAPTEPRENKIHEDDVARQYGFKGGLVPGVTVYGWLTHPVVEALGAEWLEKGSFRARLAKPTYVEQPPAIAARVAARTGADVSRQPRAPTSAGAGCGTRQTSPSPCGRGPRVSSGRRGLRSSSSISSWSPRAPVPWRRSGTRRSTSSAPPEAPPACRASAAFLPIFGSLSGAAFASCASSTVRSAR